MPGVKDAIQVTYEKLLPHVVTLLTIIFMQIHLIRFGLQTLLSFQ